MARGSVCRKAMKALVIKLCFVPPNHNALQPCLVFCECKKWLDERSPMSTVCYGSKQKKQSTWERAADHRGMTNGVCIKTSSQVSYTDNTLDWKKKRRPGCSITWSPERTPDRPPVQGRAPSKEVICDNPGQGQKKMQEWINLAWDPNGLSQTFQ